MSIRQVRIVLATIWLLLTWQPRSEAQAGPWENCKSGDVETVILDCSVVIDDKSTNQQLLAAAHDNRGVAFARNGQFDAAIADFDEAIRLDLGPLWCSAIAATRTLQRANSADQ